jgi:hypothetical protein
MNDHKIGWKMSDKIFPQPHQDSFLDALRPYIASVVLELSESGWGVSCSWLDPFDPRDATVVFRSETNAPEALVYDEETGWRVGRFVSGEPGVRTVLAGARTLNAGLLPAPAEVARCLAEQDFTEPTMFRHHNDLYDGYEERLRLAGLKAAAKV